MAHILVVDDSALVRKQLEGVLTRRRTSGFRNGQRAEGTGLRRERVRSRSHYHRREYARYEWH